VKSLLRLALAAASLCLAWMVLSPSQAHASERPKLPLADAISLVGKDLAPSTVTAPLTSEPTADLVVGSAARPSKGRPVATKPQRSSHPHLAAVRHAPVPGSGGAAAHQVPGTRGVVPPTQTVARPLTHRVKGHVRPTGGRYLAPHVVDSTTTAVSGVVAEVYSLLAVALDEPLPEVLPKPLAGIVGRPVAQILPKPLAQILPKPEAEVLGLVPTTGVARLDAGSGTALGFLEHSTSSGRLGAAHGWALSVDLEGRVPRKGQAGPAGAAHAMSGLSRPPRVGPSGLEGESPGRVPTSPSQPSPAPAAGAQTSTDTDSAVLARAVVLDAGGLAYPGGRSDVPFAALPEGPGSRPD
jgi:hypothetical protein